MEEVYTAQEVIRRYNQKNAEQTEKLFLPLGEEAVAVAGEADVVIGIVGNYVEKAEVIEQAVKVGKKVLLFFSKYQDPENTIPAEGKAVEAFMSKMESKCSCMFFGSRAELETAIKKSLIK